MESDKFLIAGKHYLSRLLVGTGKYKDFKETQTAISESGAEIVTVAIRRTNIGQDIKEESLLDFIPKEKYTYLPNTAGCYTKDDAIRTLRLARELLDGHNLVKLEVLGDPNTLYPNVVETVEAAKILIKETPYFIKKNSMIEFNKYVFAYEVEIKNESSQPIQLISRHWIIENSKFEKFEVKGEGVIGEQPTIAPGEVYNYSSFTEISTPTGFMWGSYQMLTESEISFDVEIPKFELNMPRILH